MADIATKFGLSAGGIYMGVAPPKYFTGKIYYPQHCMPSSNPTTVTSTRKFYIPMFIPFTQTFAGCKIYNSGSGDNAKTIRTGVYSQATGGGPGTLQVEFTQITLTGASAVRTATGSVTLTGGQMYFLCLHSATNPAMNSMAANDTYVTMSPLANQLGSFALIPGADVPLADYVDTAYAALPATATAPTATLGTASDRIPLMGLYV